MPRGNKKGADVVPRPHDGADDLSPMNERRPASFWVIRFNELPDEPGFGASDGGNIQQNADMRSDPDSPGMRDSLAVDENQPGRGFQAADGPDESRGFPEGKIPRNIGEPDF